MDLTERDFSPLTELCPICDSRQVFPSHTSGGLRFSSCQQCDHVFANPPLREEFLSAYYSGDYWEGRQKPAWFQFQRNVGRVLRFIQALRRVDFSRLRKNPKILEIGSGRGGIVWTLSYILRGRGYCVEPDLKFLEFSSRLGIAPVEFGAEADGQFNLVVLSHVLEHQNQPHLLLRQALRTLAPGGVMIVEVPNRNAGLDFGGVEHPMVFSEKSFSSMCAAATPTGSFFTHSKGNGAHNKYLLAILTAPDVRTEDGDSFSLRNREATVSFVNLGHGVLWKLLNRIFIYSLVAIAKQKSRHSG